MVSATARKTRNPASIKKGLRHLRGHCCPFDWQGLAHLLDLNAHISFEHRRLKYQWNTLRNQMSNFLKCQDRGADTPNGLRVTQRPCDQRPLRDTR